MPAPRQHVEAGKHLGGDDGVAVGQDQDRGAEPHPPGDAGQKAQHGQGFEQGGLGRQGKLAGVVIRIAGLDRGRQNNVIANPQGVKSQRFGLLGYTEQAVKRVGTGRQGTDMGQDGSEFHGSSL